MPNKNLNLHLFQCFCASTRYNSLILVSDDSVLSPAHLQYLARLRDQVAELQSPSWEEVCYAVPVLGAPPAPPANCTTCSCNTTQPWLNCWQQDWCDILAATAGQPACLATSLLEFWPADQETCTSITSRQSLQHNIYLFDTT